MENWKHMSTQILGYKDCCCFCSVAQSCPTLCDPMDCAACQFSLFATISWSLPKLMSIASVMPSSHLILWWPLLLLPSIFPSIRDFSNESTVCIRWPKYWNFSFSISPSSGYLGLISNQSLLRLTGLISLLSKGFSGVFSITTVQGINSLAFCLVYGPALTTVYDHWEDHSLDYTDLCWQSNVSACQYIV